MPFGSRHYFFLNKTSKLFINAQCAFGINLKSTLADNNQLFLGIATDEITYMSEAGYRYNNLFGAEVRYKPTTSITGNFWYWNSDYTTFSFLVGYTIFKK